MLNLEITEILGNRVMGYLTNLLSLKFELRGYENLSREEDEFLYNIAQLFSDKYPNFGMLLYSDNKRNMIFSRLQNSVREYMVSSRAEEVCSLIVEISCCVDFKNLFTFVLTRIAFNSGEYFIYKNLNARLTLREADQIGLGFVWQIRKSCGENDIPKIFEGHILLALNHVIRSRGTLEHANLLRKLYGEQDEDFGTGNLSSLNKLTNM